MNSRRLLDIGVGIYVAVVGLTASALLWWETVAPTFSPASVVGAGLVVAAVATLVVGTVDDLLEHITPWPVGVSVLGQTAVYFRYLLTVPEPGSTRALLGGAGVLAIVPLIFGVSITKTAKHRRLREASTEIVTVTVGEYSGARVHHWLRVGGSLFAMSIFVLLVGAMSLVWIETDSIYIGSTLLSLGLTVVGLLSTDTAKLVVTETGIWVDQSKNGQISQSFVEYDEFDGYRLTDETVELVRPKWGRSTFAFDRTAISDESALIKEVATQLPRLDENGTQSVEGPFQR